MQDASESHQGSIESIEVKMNLPDDNESQEASFNKFTPTSRTFRGDQSSKGQHSLQMDFQKFAVN